jgi:alkylation response protein AidB-like acyl-CoA dehydrogenase
MARTDPDAPKHKGISMFRVDMKAPGVTIRPIMSMNGTSEEFNEVFFEDVEIPAEDLIGEENKGWYSLMGLLNAERSAISAVKQIERTFESILGLAQDPEYQPLTEEMRTDLANRKIEVEVMRALSELVARKQLGGSNLANEASILKLFHTELNQRLASTAIKVAGQHGLLSSEQEDAPLNSLIGDHYLYASTLTIQVGTSEVQRNIIAMRGLEMPRS